MFESIRRRFANLRAWWHAPVTRRDRSQGALIGAIGGFWLGVLGFVAVSVLSSGPGLSAWWALSLVVPGAVAGCLVPKPVMVLLFPFACFGGST
jgi:hypothetical protein